MTCTAYEHAFTTTETLDIIDLGILRMDQSDTFSFSVAKFYDLELDYAAKELSAFISKTGGLQTNNLTIKNIANAKSKYKSIVEKFDRIVCVVSRALLLLEKEKLNSYLNPSNGAFDACFEFKSVSETQVNVNGDIDISV